MLTNIVRELEDNFRKYLPFFQKRLRNRQYERSSEGIYLPKDRVTLGGIMGGAVRQNGELLQGWGYNHNVVTDEGLNSLINVYLHDTAKISTWYLAPFTSGSPAGNLTAATFPSAHSETTLYSESTRQEFNNAASTAQSTTNDANMATFTASAEVTVLGLALLSVSTKSSTSGVCFAAALFPTSLHLPSAGSELLGKYTFTAADA